MSIEWSQSFETGISDIDAQHRGLFRLIERLNSALTDDSLKKRIILELLEALDDYTRLHFYAEEILMEENQYPDIQAHKESHRRFENFTMSLQKNLKSQNNETSFRSAAEDLSSFLNDWLVKHIQHSDQDYLPYMKLKKI